MNINRMLLILAGGLSLGLLFASCKQAKDALIDTGLKNIFFDKYKALGWDTQSTTAVGDAIKTKGGNGYVQYYSYNGRKRAIYYSNNGAFGLEPDLVDKYDALGQETFKNGALGYPSSDAKPCGNGCVYADFENGVIIKSPAVSSAVTVYGEIYKKYVSLNRWAGVLAYPKTDELDLTSKRGRYNGFQYGQIFWNSSTGAQAFWGQVEKLYGATGYDTGWLGLPTSSCELNVSVQTVRFENGLIQTLSSTCGAYFNKAQMRSFQNGTQDTQNVRPCY